MPLQAEHMARAIKTPADRAKPVAFETLLLIVAERFDGSGGDPLQGASCVYHERRLETLRTLWTN
jgi:hypothetical protein